MSGKPTLGYWKIRGLAYRIKLLLTYLGVDYDDKLYDYGSGSEPSMESWFADKFNLGLEFPNVPYWIDDKVKITESWAIFRYVAETKGGKLYPASPQDHAVLNMVQGVVSDVQNALVELAYSKTGIPEEPLEKKMAPKFQQLNKFFESRKYILGDEISYMDFYAYEAIVEYRRYKSEVLKPYPALERFVNTIETLPQLVEFIKATDKLPCYSPFATLQF